jgi:hypothetical protein
LVAAEEVVVEQVEAVTEVRFRRESFGYFLKLSMRSLLERVEMVQRVSICDVRVGLRATMARREGLVQHLE